ILANRGELSAMDIYAQFSVSPQAISQHLKVLREANLVVMEKHAQKHLYSLNHETLSQFEAWVQRTRLRWEERFSTFVAFTTRCARQSALLTPLSLKGYRKKDTCVSKHLP